MSRLLILPVILMLACAQVTPPEKIDLPISNLKWLLKDSSLLDQMAWDQSGFYMYATAEDKDSARVERFVAWEDTGRFLDMVRTLPLDFAIEVYSNDSLYTSFLPTILTEEVGSESIDSGAALPLQGWRIAIDPGHTAHNMETAVVEDRFVKIRKEEIGTDQDLAFYEADLTLKTALLIRDLLTEQGAQVFLTRDKAGGVLPKKFEQWVAEDREEYVDNLLAEGKIDSTKHQKARAMKADRYLYRSWYNRADLEKRAELLNGYRPDLSVIIHFNIAGEGKKKSDFMPVIAENFCMAFVAGGFAKGELKDVASRMHFLRQLFSTDLQKSVEVSDKVIQQHVGLLGVPIVGEPNDLVYLNKYSVLSAAEGVYHRNLKLTRLLNGPIVFGESLLQNNREEALTLSTNDSERIRQVAEAYFKGIMAYAGPKEKVSPP